jgi:hypothetical protein
VAQWIAHRTSNPGVAGSSPAQGKKKEKIYIYIFFCFVCFNSICIYIHIYIYIYIYTKQNIRDGVVGNISACHADARGSIPRRGVYKKWQRHFGRVG